METTVGRPLEGAAACELRNVTKRFAGVVALNAVSFDVRRGEIHVLLGENGAGKSTLVKALTGIYRPDEGELLIDGEEVRLADPHDARQKGIGLVAQDVLVVPEFSIGRNILLGSEGRLSRRDELSRSERATVRDALASVGADFDYDVPTASLSVPEQRLAELARALVNPGDVLLLDEPTATVSEHDSERLMEILGSFRDGGKGIVYVTHRLSEAMRLADRITILRDGCVVGSFARGEASKDEIVALMAKDDRADLHTGEPEPAAARPPVGEPLLEVEGLTSGGFSGVDLRVRSGQIVGIAGVQGSGHGDFVKAVAGLIPAHGSVRVAGSACPLGRPVASFHHGIILVPADRRRAAIVSQLSVLDNISVSPRVRNSARRLGLRWPRRERQMANQYVDRMSIRPKSVATAVGDLSGGNQQKVALARALEGNAQVLLVEEPTQGIDIHAKAEIRRLLLEFAATGRAVVVATSEFEELKDLADEVVVMCLGRVVGRLDGPDITYRNILSHALP